MKERLIAAHPHLSEKHFDIVAMTTTGDQVYDKLLNDIGGKGLFTKEIEEALLENRVDIAVHSMKDMPTELPEGLIIPCMLEREDPRDAFISLNGNNLESLPLYAVVGTASLRRAAQIKAFRKDLEIVPIRGNVHTRLRKLAEGHCDATILAMAGLKRLAETDVVTHVLPADMCLPAVGQGAIGVECLASREDMQQLIAAINHQPTFLTVSAEREMLKVLDGSCRTPIAGFAQLQGRHMVIEGMVAMADGKKVHRNKVEGTVSTVKQAQALGHALGVALDEKRGRPAGA